MLLTLCTGSLARLVSRNGKGGLTIYDMPDFTIRELQLHGLNVVASMLAGCSLTDLEKLRDRADKAACPCLVLVADQGVKLGDSKPAVRAEAVDRVRRYAMAANRLGCNALSLMCEAADTAEGLETAATEIRALMPVIERAELNLLLAPCSGVSQKPERLTDLIKRIGGFRIGSLPSFAHAASAAGGDPIEPLRKLAPYAGAIHATVAGFSKKGVHKGYDLATCVAAVRSVGFGNTLAIDYVGTEDPRPNIETARTILQAAIDAEET